MSATRDWADELAATIVADIWRDPDPRPLVAARLRVLKNQGMQEGLGIAATTIKQIFEPGTQR